MGMFERYTESARRVIFFGRYEASQVGDTEIAPEHLTLGLLREWTNQTVSITGIGKSMLGEIRSDIFSKLQVKEKLDTSLDLPLTQASQQVLDTASEEADRLDHRHIGIEHLLLSLLKVEGVPGAVLRKTGVTWQKVNDELVLLSGQPKPEDHWSELLDRLEAAVPDPLTGDERNKIELRLRELLFRITG